MDGQLPPACSASDALSSLFLEPPSDQKPAMQHPNLHDSRWIDEDNPEILPPARPQNWATRCRQYFSKYWNPKSVQPPLADPDLPYYSAPERAAEVLRYFFSFIEHWLSPLGTLREWIRLNARIAIFLLIPILLVVPLISYALGQLNIWAALIATMTSQVVVFPLSALLLVGLIFALIHVSKSLMGRHTQGRRPPPNYYE